MEITNGRVSSLGSTPAGSNFTGQVWRDPVGPRGEGIPPVNVVFFAPGARTHWHRHEHGQLLFVTHGQGFVATRDGQSAVITPGDVVYAPPGEEHCHGAGDDTFLIHTAISLGRTEWLEEVSGQQWRSVLQESSPQRGAA